MNANKNEEFVPNTFNRNEDSAKKCVEANENSEFEEKNINKTVLKIEDQESIHESLKILNYNQEDTALCYFMNCPDLIIEKIFQYLNLESFRNASQTCKKFNKISRRKILWQNQFPLNVSETIKAGEGEIIRMAITNDAKNLVAINSRGRIHSWSLENKTKFKGTYETEMDFYLGSAFMEFNKAGNFLLVASTWHGNLIIFRHTDGKLEMHCETKNFKFITSCWYDDENFFSAEEKEINGRKYSALWLNSVTMQERCLVIVIQEYMSLILIGNEPATESNSSINEKFIIFETVNGVGLKKISQHSFKIVDDDSLLHFYSTPDFEIYLGELFYMALASDSRKLFAIVWNEEEIKYKIALIDVRSFSREAIFDINENIPPYFISSWDRYLILRSEDSDRPLIYNRMNFNLIKKLSVDHVNSILWDSAEPQTIFTGRKNGEVNILVSNNKLNDKRQL